MKTYRVTMAMRIDVYADSKEMAEELAADALLEDHVPHYIVEMLDPVATELDLAVDIMDGSWDPINDCE